MNRDERLIEEMMSTCRHDCGYLLSEIDPCDEEEMRCELSPTGYHEQLLTGSDVVWKICSRCRGEGMLRGYPGVYTSDDFQNGDVDLDDYLGYTRPCEDCDALGKVRVLSDAAREREEVNAYLNDAYDLWAIEAAERRAGA